MGRAFNENMHILEISRIEVEYPKNRIYEFVYGNWLLLNVWEWKNVFFQFLAYISQKTENSFPSKMEGTEISLPAV